MALPKPSKALLTVLTVPSFRNPSAFHPRIQPNPFRRPPSSLFLLDRQPIIFNQHLDPGLDQQATLLAAAKIKWEHRERVLNHTMGKLDRIYNQHDFDDEKQVALETLERKIDSIITGEKGKVIPITAGQKVA